MNASRERFVASAVMVLIGMTVLAPTAMGAVSPVQLQPIVDPEFEELPTGGCGLVLDAHSLLLKWTPAAEQEATGFLIRFSTEPDVGESDPVAAEISDPSASSVVVSDLNLGTTYYFRVYVVDPSGEVGPGSNEVTGTTRANSYPFFDDMEGALDGWDLVLTTWDTTSAWSNSPTHSWTDSPDTNYTNLSDRSLVTAVNLMSAEMPVLSFAQYHNVQTDGDQGYVEVSEDGGSNWERICATTGSSSGWLEEKIDLTPYRGNQNLKIRWRLVANSFGVSDGWYIDDVSVAETPYATWDPPLYDSVNDEAHSDSLWLSSSWIRVPGGVGSGHYWTDSPQGDFAEYLSTKITSSGEIDLASTAQPWLVFSHRLDLEYQNSAQVELSIDGGVNWDVLRTWDGPLSISTWTQEAVDLSEYAGGAVRVRFHLLNLGVQSAGGWDLDRVQLAEFPENVTLSIASSTQNSVGLEWTQYSGTDFGAYEIYRYSECGFLLDRNLIATIGDLETTAFGDPVAPDLSYCYRLFVVGSDGRYLEQSNTVFRDAFDLPLLSYPFIDDMEGGDGNFLAEVPWSVTDEVSHSGSYSWSDSPYGNYENSVTTSVALRIDLSGGTALMPELRFWQQYGLGTNSDWGYVDASTDGGVTYRPIYYITGTSGEWQKERVDLTGYRGHVLYLRFRIQTSTSGQADGWHIDDIAIGETETVPIAYPFVDSFNDSLFTHTSWMSSGYGWTVPSDDGTYYWSNRSTGDLPDLYGSHGYGCTVMTLGNSIDLGGAVHPQVRLRYRAEYYDNPYNDDYARTYLQLSQDGGASYTTLQTFPDATSWTTLQLDLSGYVGGAPIRLRLYTYDYDTGTPDPFFDVEDLAVVEDPALTPQVNYCRLDQPAIVWLTVGQTSPQIFAQVYEPGVTDSSGQGAGVLAQIGRGPDGTYPMDSASGWNWATATYGGDAAGDSMDVYYGTIAGGGVGVYDYAFRFSIDGGTHWIYADLDGTDMGGGGFNYYDTSQAGDLVVTLRPEFTISATEIELTLPVGQTASRVITIGNDGVGPLMFTGEESTSPPVPEEVTWLGVAPESGMLEPWETRNLTISVDATDLEENTNYDAYIVLLTNDPDYTEVDIPVTVHVVPPSEPHLAGTVLNVDLLAPEETAYVEVMQGDTLVASATVGADGYYSIFGIAEGTYLVRTHSEGYYPAQDDVYIPATGVNFTLHRVPHFYLTNTSANFYGEGTLFESSPVEVGDVVTAQDADDILCGAYYVGIPGHYGFMHVYGDDATTTDVDEGASAGDTLTFRINGELAQPTGPDEPVWPGDGAVLHVELHAQATRNDTLFLDESWNLISFNRVPDSTGIEDILAPLLADTNVVVVSSFDQEWGGARTYDPELPGQSDLWEMDPRHGYWIKTRRADTLVVVGDRFWGDTPMPLEQNWNLVSYLPEETRDVERALGSIDALYSYVSGFDEGAGVYVPGSGFSTLTHLANGFGYWIKMGYLGVLRYDFLPGGRGQAPPRADAVLAGGTNERDYTPTAWWDSFYGVVAQEGEPVPSGEFIQAYDPQGVVCGEFVTRDDGIYGFMPIYGDDPYTPETDEGAEYGDKITFYYNGATVETDPETVFWRGDQSLVEFNLSFPVETGGPDPEIPTAYCLYRAYPNPVSGSTTLRYDLPKPGHVRLAIYDVSGRLVTELVDTEEAPGQKRVQWSGLDSDGHSVASGVYYYRLETASYSGEGRLVVLK
ncbi:MAG: fibronectin type III domain-containing protein [Candidatus Eisenbacteria bacterium]